MRGRVVTLPLQPPQGMTLSHYARVLRLTAARRDLVEERAAIIHEATGCSWAEADRIAFESEGSAQAVLPGTGSSP